QASLPELRADSSSGVGQQNPFDTHAAEDAHGKRDPLHGVTLAVVHASLHRRHRHIAASADHKISRVTLCAGSRKMWNVGIGNGNALLQLIRKGTEPRAQNEPDLRTKRGLLCDIFGGFAGARVIVENYRIHSASRDLGKTVAHSNTRHLADLSS